MYANIQERMLWEVAFQNFITTNKKDDTPNCEVCWTLILLDEIGDQSNFLNGGYVC